MRCAEGNLREWQGPVVVLSGDVPLLRASTIRQLINKLSETDAAAVILTGRVNGDHSYGRVLRDANSTVKAIVEHKDATPEQKALRAAWLNGS